MPPLPFLIGLALFILSALLLLPKAYSDDAAMLQYVACMTALVLGVVLMIAGLFL